MAAEWYCWFEQPTAEASQQSASKSDGSPGLSSWPRGFARWLLIVRVVAHRCNSERILWKPEVASCVTAYSLPQSRSLLDCRTRQPALRRHLPNSWRRGVPTMTRPGAAPADGWVLAPLAHQAAALRSKHLEAIQVTPDLRCLVVTFELEGWSQSWRLEYRTRTQSKRLRRPAFMRASQGDMDKSAAANPMDPTEPQEAAVSFKVPLVPY